MGIRYYKNLTLKENSVKNNCSVSAIKAHLSKRNISASKARRSVIASKVSNAKVELEKMGKRATVRAICDLTGFSNKTIIKYSNNGERKDIAKSTPRSFSFRQGEILQNIINLYCGGDPIECDLTYSMGKMWKGLQRPQHLFDLKPQLSEVKQLDEVRQYINYFSSCLFDLPFIIRPQSQDSNSIISDRFDAFASERELYEVNTSMLVLAFSILIHKGLCVVKTQDTNYAGKQIWTHQHIMNEAIRLGFRIEDIFVCLRKNMLVNNCKSVAHARKQHCFFIVLRKTKK